MTDDERAIREMVDRWMEASRAGDTTTVLRLPLAPVAYLMAVMLLVGAVIHLWLIFVPHAADDGKSIV